METLDKNDLFSCRDNLDKIIRLLGDRRSELYSEELISQSDFLLLGSIERKLIDIKDEITVQIIGNILVNTNAAKTRIDQAIAVINQKLGTLKKINDALSLFANVINLFNGILGGTITKTIPDLAALLTPFF